MIRLIYPAISSDIVRVFLLTILFIFHILNLSNQGLRKREAIMARYLIQGLFFQAQDRIKLGIGDGTDSGVAESLFRIMFAGFISPQIVEGKPVLVGEMNDQNGESTLTDIIIEPESLQFIKQYNGSPLKIKYIFQLKNGIWVGEYFEPSIGSGQARCILTEVPEEFFSPK
jgi:hypothetical protein